MKFGKGTVKKYSREYTRTLKSGEKRKYKTEQIQITIQESLEVLIFAQKYSKIQNPINALFV